MDDLVHFEEDFSSQTEMWSGGPVRSGWLSQPSPIPRSPDGDKKKTSLCVFGVCHSDDWLADHPSCVKVLMSGSTPPITH